MHVNQRPADDRLQAALALDLDEHGRWCVLRGSVVADTVSDGERSWAIPPDWGIDEIRWIDADTVLLYARCSAPDDPGAATFDLRSGRVLRRFCIGTGVSSVVTTDNFVLVTYDFEGMVDGDELSGAGAQVYSHHFDRLRDGRSFATARDGHGRSTWGCATGIGNDQAMLFEHSGLYVCDLKLATIQGGVLFPPGDQQYITIRGAAGYGDSFVLAYYGLRAGPVEDVQGAIQDALEAASHLTVAVLDPSLAAANPSGPASPPVREIGRVIVPLQSEFRTIGEGQWLIGQPHEWELLQVSH